MPPTPCQHDSHPVGRRTLNLCLSTPKKSLRVLRFGPPFSEGFLFPSQISTPLFIHLRDALPILSLYIILCPHYVSPPTKYKALYPFLTSLLLFLTLDLQFKGSLRGDPEITSHPTYRAYISYVPSQITVLRAENKLGFNINSSLMRSIPCL